MGDQDGPEYATLSYKVKYRSVFEDNDIYALKEPASPYKVDFTAKKQVLRLKKGLK
ncbi:hypothetical protein MNBD_GAMMA11-2558 [hydrothermal vent metagenome]|uniref:Uncharacterized protein n=1 Tax=hydrothermal vent metagenome TaxID=652676 RepID=A0A3B0XSC7_9ZZZZ